MIRNQRYILYLEGEKERTEQAEATANSRLEHIPKALFTSNSFGIGFLAESSLQKGLRFLQANNLAGLDLRGHAAPGEDKPKELAEKRVTAVKNWYLGKGISSERLTISSYGDARPINTQVREDGTPDQDAISQNRRVEIAPRVNIKETSPEKKSGEKALMEITPYLIGDVVVTDQTAKLQELSFTIGDSSAWSSVITYGAEINFIGGTSENMKHLFKGNVSQIKPSYDEQSGRINLSVTAYQKGWKEASLTQKDLFYPSENHPLAWAQKKKLYVAEMLENIAKDSGLSIGRLELDKDLAYTYEQPIRQDNETDWAFINKLARKIEAAVWLDMDAQDVKLYCVSRTVLLNEQGVKGFFLPSRLGPQFVIDKPDRDLVKLHNAKVSLDPLSSRDKAKIDTHVDPETGETVVTREELDPETMEWRRWVLDRAKLAALSTDEKFNMVNQYMAGNLGWEQVKKFFVRVSYKELSSREPQLEDKKTSIAGEGPSADGKGGSTETAKQLESAKNWSEYEFDYNELGKITSTQEKLKLIKLYHDGKLTWENSGQYSAKKYFKRVKKTEEEEVDNGIKAADTTSMGPAKKSKKKIIGFNIQASCYGDLDIMPRKTYPVIGLDNYNGEYYLEEVTYKFGPRGFLMDLMFVR